MSENLVKVKAKHQIVHDGQTLKAGTFFNAPESLVTELTKADAIELVSDNPEGKPVVELSPVLAAPTIPLSPQDAKLAADQKRLADAHATLAADGLDTSPVVLNASGSAAHPV